MKGRTERNNVQSRIGTEQIEVANVCFRFKCLLSFTVNSGSESFLLPV
jgi:hypothetical protein